MIIALALLAGLVQAAVLTITTQPEPVYTDPGDLVMFSVQATASSGTLSYAWMKDSAPLADNEYVAGSTLDRISISPAHASDAGNYSVIVSDYAASVTSSVAVLALDLPLPSILAEPADTTVPSGGHAQFTLTATNAVSYQWYLGETAISNGGSFSGTTTSTLQINPAHQANNAVYSVRVSNARGTVASTAARLTVTSTASLNEALDNNNVLIDHSTGWFSQSGTTSDGTDAVQSAHIGFSSETEMGVSLVGPGEYTFQWLVSSEASYDLIHWLQDNQSLGSISGQPASWAQEAGFVPDNAHTVSWRYTTDYAEPVGLDAGFVDQFVFTPYGLSSVEKAIDNPPPTPLVFGGPARWYGQDNTTHDGTDAARSPKTGHNETSWFETTVQGPGMVTFWSKTSTENTYDNLLFSVDGSTLFSQSGSSGWMATTNWIDWGTHTLRWAYAKDYAKDIGDDAVWVDQISYTPVERSSLAEAADDAGLDWTTSGTNPWFGQGRFTDDGTDALQSGVTEHNGESWIKTAVTGPGTLSFRWRTSSENNYDRLRFYVNGDQQGTISGENGWTTVSLDLTNSILHELEWKYSKDYERSDGQDAGFVDQVVFAPQRDPVTLSVASALGSPSPAVGIYTNDYNTPLTCSVAHVQAGQTQYECTGWTGSGSIPASGTSNAVEATLTENSSITWNWQTNYWLDVNITGSGSVSHSDGWYAMDSEQTLIATPAEGWLFMGWSGDASGTNNAVLTMNTAKTIMANFSDDADNDGLTNTEEAAAGSNPWKKDTDDDGFDDAFEVAKGWNPTVDDSDVADYIGANGDDFGLYPSNVVLDVAVGQMLLETDSGNATLSLQLEESDDLDTWTNAGPAEVWSWPVDGEKKYFRVRSSK
ncbi:hypothetical protein SCARR_04107 [Pontiella sulfatireligans]|uniref:Ig-like domain-containing protein n=2 Tax=Pontiella sulfatireligans TaxID=2750658 RepID=A0A6C2UT01_9BACT|nr:hypothetical protein SCARR_04107 [Pontiella sulfatireligans]